jgi:hypothetical protein
MKFYRVRSYVNGGNSGPSRWFTARKDAEAAKREDDAADPHEEPGEIDEILITPSKAGILAALRMHASHPDNG